MFWAAVESEQLFAVSFASSSVLRNRGKQVSRTYAKNYIINIIIESFDQFTAVRHVQPFKSVSQPATRLECELLNLLLAPTHHATLHFKRRTTLTIRSDILSTKWTVGIFCVFHFKIEIYCRSTMAFPWQSIRSFFHRWPVSWYWGGSHELPLFDTDWIQRADKEKSNNMLSASDAERRTSNSPRLRERARYNISIRYFLVNWPSYYPSLDPVSSNSSCYNIIGPFPRHIKRHPHAI